MVLVSSSQRLAFEMAEDAPADFQHTPVLLDAVLAGLAPRSGGRYIDATVGGGGHSAALLQASSPDGQLLGIDADTEALQAATRVLEQYTQRLQLVHGNFREIASLAQAHGFAAVDGILIDLGVSSYQLDRPERGFSFQEDGPLDMRLDQSQGLSAAALLQQISETELANLIYRYGEERASRRIARFIVETHRRSPITSTAELAAIVSRAMGGRHGRIHPATRTFQALRIAVNAELESLEAVLPQAVELLKPGAALAVISFHSLEDRIVKIFFRSQAGPAGRLRIGTKKPIEADTLEARNNPRSRSAKLRIAYKQDEEVEAYGS